MRVMVEINVLLTCLLPLHICFSKEGIVIEPDESSGPAVKTENRIEAEEMIDDNNYYWNPWCGDKPVSRHNNCFCGNRTLDALNDLSEGDLFCCVTPSSSGHDQFTGGG